MSTKFVHVQAKDPGGSLVFDSEVAGKSNRQKLIRFAMLRLDEYCSIATIRCQVEGARGWAYFRYECRSNHCDLDPTISW
jgi:hypothetical protein